MSSNQTKFTTTYHIEPADSRDEHWWDVSDECAVGGGSGVRITYREIGRETSGGDFLDIVAKPAALRSIAHAILRKADEQDGGEQ